MEVFELFISWVWDLRCCLYGGWISDMDYFGEIFLLCNEVGYICCLCLYFLMCNVFIIFMIKWCFYINLVR